MIRVVRMIARLNVGGPARHVVWLTAGLPGDRFETTLITGVVPAGEEDMAWFAAAEGVKPVVIPEMSREISPRDLITIWKTWRLLVREQPHIIHTHTAKAGTAGRIAAMLYRRARVVHTYHGHIFHGYYGRWKTKLFLMIERALAKVTDRIIVLGEQQLEEIHGTFKVGRREQFAVIPLGIDLGAFAHWRSRRAPAREGLGAADDDLLIGIAGRLTEIKNHELFLEVAAEWLRRQPSSKARFLVIGDGHRRAALEAQAGKNVEFLGNRTDLEAIYPALDIVVLTSRNEGTPLTLIEAMANGRAVVATAVGGVGDVVNEDRGVTVPPDDPKAFCNALEKLASDADLRERLGRSGEEYVKRTHDKARLLRDICTLYEGLIGRQLRQ